MIDLLRNNVIKITRIAKIKINIKKTKKIIKYIYGYISYNIKSVTGEKIRLTSFLTSSVCNMSKHCLIKEFDFDINILITIQFYTIYFECLLSNTYYQILITKFLLPNTYYQILITEYLYRILIACFINFIFLLFQ